MNSDSLILCSPVDLGKWKCEECICTFLKVLNHNLQSNSEKHMILENPDICLRLPMYKREKLLELSRENS